MEIVVLVKPVPDAESRLRPNAGGTELDGEGIKWVLSGYDESAVEQALLLKAAVPGSSVRCISFGPAPRTEEVLRASVALGCDRATWVERPVGMPADPLLCARVLREALRKYPHDLILAGKQAGDDEEGIVPSALAELLGVESFGSVVDLRWHAEEKRFRFQCVLDSGSEKVEAAGPLLIGLQQAWNDPRTATLPNILRSRKATIDRLPWSDVAPLLGAFSAGRTTSQRFRLPPPRTGARLIDYQSPEEAAEKLVKILREEAKVFP
ncbi:MAG: electron transfer flavoprotein subunit beta/FixA family protein [Thermoplasmata archaeon]|nr:electron transfer flavoprotein subunit beta/FixA family protein [Thermoplasmata archaeon]